MNKIDDITIMNAWMFPTVFADERNLKLTKQLIEICMNRKIESIQQASVEHHVKPRVNYSATSNRASRWLCHRNFSCVTGMLAMCYIHRVSPL